MPSTVIHSFTYNADSKTLHITFVTGLRYNYLDVPEEVYEQLKVSKSKGIFFNQNIRNQYAFIKQEE